MSADRLESTDIINIYIQHQSLALPALNHLCDSRHEVPAELVKAELPHHLLPAPGQPLPGSRKHLVHFLGPLSLCSAQEAAPFAHGLPRPSAVVGNDGHSHVHRLAGHYPKVLVLGSVEHALGLSQQVLSGFVADGHIKMDVVGDAQLGSQFL